MLPLLQGVIETVPVTDELTTSAVFRFVNFQVNLVVTFL